MSEEPFWHGDPKTPKVEPEEFYQPVCYEARPPRYRPVYYSGHTLLVQRIYGIWCWSVEFPDGSGIDGWTFSKRGAYRAAFNVVPR